MIWIILATFAVVAAINVVAVVAYRRGRRDGIEHAVRYHIEYARDVLGHDPAEHLRAFDEYMETRLDATREAGNR